MHSVPAVDDRFALSCDSLGNWLRSTLKRAIPFDVGTTFPPTFSDRAELAVCVAELLHGEPLTHPSAAAMRRWESRLRELPPQVSQPVSTTAFGYWIGIAAIAELESDVPLARMVLNELEKQIDANSDSSAVQHLSDRTSLNPPIDEMRGIIWARRGRLARLAGHLSDAEECYREAARFDRNHHAPEANAQAQLGLAALSAMRGNHPAVLRRCRALLRGKVQLATVYRVHAHQLIALSARKKRLFAEALRSAWYAFEFLDKTDFRRSELLLSMAEIAEEMGESAAAHRGFHAVVQSEAQARIKIPALVGAIRISFVAPTAAPDTQVAWLIRYGTEARRLLENCSSPHDVVALLVSLATIAESRKDWSECERLLERASSVAKGGGFFELEFRIEGMRADFSTIRTDAVNVTRENERGMTAAEGQQVHASRELIEKLLSSCID